MVTQTYDDIADWYASWVIDAEQDPFVAAMWDLLGDVAGHEICDLGCGEGRLARQLAAQGAEVTGIDSAAKLLQIARERQPPDGPVIHYVLDDAQHLRSISNGSFEGVVCHMALMDIPDITATFATVARILRPEGWFVFSILHPCYHTPTSSEGIDASGRLMRTVSDYWSEGFWHSESRLGPPARVGSHHRTLSTYFNGLIRAGFAIQRVSEPQAAGSLAEKRPVWSQVPAVRAVRCKKLVAEC